MKKIINGKCYNTETAEEIATWSNRYYPNDFQYCEETLYRTKKGAWFTHGEGGAMSSYATPCGQNCWGGGSDIRPLDESEAKEWLEEKGKTAALETHFEIEEA